MILISIVFAFFQFDLVLAQVFLNPLDSSLSTKDIIHQFQTMPATSSGTLDPSSGPPIFMLFTAFGGNNEITSNISTLDLVIYDLCNDDIGVVRVITSTASENKLINVYGYASNNYYTMATDVKSSVDLSKYVKISKSSNNRTYGIYDMNVPPKTDSFFVILYNEDHSKYVSHYVNISYCSGYDMSAIQNDDDNTFILPPPYFTDVSIKSFTESTSSETVMVEEPETVMVEEPETVMVEEPETVMVEEPETVMVEEPETVMVEEPETVMVEEPETVMVEEPETVMVEEPETVMVEEPETVMVEEPETVMVEEPETVMVEEPETVMVEEPETVMVEEPETVMVEEPETVMVEEPEINKKQNNVVGYNGPKFLLDQYYLFSDSINEQKFDIVYFFDGDIYPVIEYENQISFYLGDFVSDSLLLHLPKPLFNENYDVVLKSNNGQKSFARYDVIEYGIDYSILDIKLSKDSIKLDLILNIKINDSNQYIIINSCNNEDLDLTDSFIKTLSKVFGF